MATKSPAAKSTKKSAASVAAAIAPKVRKSGSKAAAPATAVEATTKRGDYSKFQGGHKGATYNCGVCKKLTRETGHDESSVQLCAYCYRESSLENELSDGHITQEQFTAKMAKLDKEYGRGEHAPKKGKGAAKAQKVAEKGDAAVLAHNESIDAEAAPTAKGKKGKAPKAPTTPAAAPANVPSTADLKSRGPKATVCIDELRVFTGSGARYSFAFEGKVQLLVAENPKRGKAGARFAMYKDGMDVAKALELGITRSDIKRDLEYGFIKLVK